jgi:hypothetical protein
MAISPGPGQQRGPGAAWRTAATSWSVTGTTRTTEPVGSTACSGVHTDAPPGVVASRYPDRWTAVRAHSAARGRAAVGPSP